MICPHVRSLAPYSFLPNVVFFIVLTAHFPVLNITQTSIHTEWIWQFSSKILSFFSFWRNIRLSWTFLHDNDVQWISQVKSNFPHLFWLSWLASRLRGNTVKHEPRKKPLHETKAPLEVYVEAECGNQMYDMQTTNNRLGTAEATDWFIRSNGGEETTNYLLGTDMQWKAYIIWKQIYHHTLHRQTNLGLFSLLSVY